VVEPGFFRTDFLDASSLVKAGREIADYAATVGQMRGSMADANHRQPGDPKKLSKALLMLAHSATPPVRLPLGSDTVARIGEKNRFVEAEMREWLAVSTSTDHDDVAR
jgi:hypothetical protein